MYERVTLRLDEVTELHYVHRTRQGMFTVFDFRCGNLHRRGLALRGRLDVHAGMRITGVLRVPGQWETLVAWRFEQDGREIWLQQDASPAITLTGLILAAVASVVTGWWIILMAMHSNQPAVGLGLGALSLSVYVGKAFFDWRNSRAIAALLRERTRGRAF